MRYIFISTTKSIEEAALLLPNVLKISFPEYKSLERKFPDLGKKITFFWFRNKKKYLKKENVPTSRKVLLNRRSLSSDKKLESDLVMFTLTRGLCVYGKSKKGLFLLDGNHRRLVLNKKKINMKVWMVDLEKFWQYFIEEIRRK